MIKRFISKKSDQAIKYIYKEIYEEKTLNEETKEINYLINLQRNHEVGSSV